VCFHLPAGVQRKCSELLFSYCDGTLFALSVGSSCRSTSCPKPTLFHCSYCAHAAHCARWGWKKGVTGTNVICPLCCFVYVLLLRRRFRLIWQLYDVEAPKDFHASQNKRSTLLWHSKTKHSKISGIGRILLKGIIGSYYFKYIFC